MIEIIDHCVVHANESGEVFLKAVQTCIWLANRYTEVAKDIFNSAVIEKLVKVLGTEAPQVVSASCRVLGSLLSGQLFDAQAVIKLNLVDQLAPLLTDKRKRIRKDACWVLSNVMGGTSDMVDIVFDFQDQQIIKMLIHMVDNDDYTVTFLLYSKPP